MNEPSPKKKNLVFLKQPRLGEDREAFKARVKEALREKGLLRPTEDDEPSAQPRHPGPDSPT